MSTEQLLPKYTDKPSLDAAPAYTPPTQVDEPQRKKCKKVILRKIVVFSLITWLAVHLFGAAFCAKQDKHVGWRAGQWWDADETMDFGHMSPGDVSTAPPSLDRG